MTGISSDQEHQIRELVVKGKKIAAVKLYREVTGASLKDAKDAVDAIEMGTVIGFPETIQIGEIDPALESRIKRLLAERKKIDAVKAYREVYNCGLKEAKEAVDFIEMQMRTGNYSSKPPASAISLDPFAEDAQRSRRFLALVLAIAVVVIAGLVFFLRAGNGF
jgi:ribosomal protein L7/L12